MRLWVELKGCDESTHVEVEASESDRSFLADLAEAVALASSSGCEPVMIVHKGPMPG